MPRNRNPRATSGAQTARAHPSVAEEIVWQALRANKIGFKFRREHPIAGYRLDFYCREALLAVEMDGEQHEALRDAVRDKALADLGIRTIRISNRSFFGLEPAPYQDEILMIQKLCEERTGRLAFS